MRHFWAVLAVAAGAVAGCGNDDGGPVGDGLGCSIEPNFVSIHTDLLTTDRCATSGCHGASMAGNLSLSGDLDAVFTELLTEEVTHPDAVQTRRVVPEAPENSFLFVKIADVDPPGDRMPLGGELRPCEIDVIRTWIEAGAARR